MAALGFTPASQQDIFSIESTRSENGPKTGSVLSGDEARKFYEDLMKDDKVRAGSRTNHQNRQKNRESIRRVRRRAQQVQTSVVQSGGNEGHQMSGTSYSERSQELQGLRLLRCAHEGDITGLKDLLARGVDINYQDTYFWTALMCASWSGQRSAVGLLLQHGAAWVGVVDIQGRDARDLALEAGHNEVVEELMGFGRSTQRDSQRNNSPLQRQWCDVCRSECSGSLSSHLSSTLHQFNLRRPPPTPYYCLPPSSNSYKMMVRCGWQPGTGLGPEGEGTKQPVPTVLKRDQMGLGYGQGKKAKVTHFKARDHDAIKPPSRDNEQKGQKGQKKEESNRKEQKDKNWERDFRTSFYL
ncbi:G patch domain and ankyrin repeat-containing protein 1 [Parambassis ranga]|uniref:G patch domain and ankyrin repeat-containing protein 1 n=1 Tax=Parambassis ranga TaxID=210632 RepID=A0A6P7I1U8_9TELE|nr:G patch domain and ankyrin repeat-containing protein 1-like [Parambassis ranga]